MTALRHSISGGPEWKQTHTDYSTRTGAVFNGNTLLITIYFEIMRCQQQKRLNQQVRLDKYLIVATAVVYGQQH